MFDISRRVFLELLGAAAAGATMASGKLSDAADAAVRLVRPRPWYERGAVQRTYSYCDMCLWKCGIVVSTVNGQVVKIDGNPLDPKSNGRLCARGNAGLAALYDPDRLKKPLIRVAGSQRGDGRYQEASWEAALDYSAEKLLAVKKAWGGPEAVAFFGHGTADGWFAEYLPQAFGTPNTAKPSVSVCVGPREVAATLTYGRAFGGHEPVDWDETNYIVLIGNHIGENAHNTPMQQLADARARGATLVVVDPRFSSVAMKADTWMPIKPATDTALILAWINVLISEQLWDREFVERYTEGFGKLAEAVRANTPEWAAQITDLSADEIRAVARGLAAAKPRAVVVPSRHVAWYGNDTQRNRAIFILNALLGSPGRPGGFWIQKAPWIEEYPHPAFGATADAGGCSAPGEAGAAESEGPHQTRPRADGGDGIKFMTGSVAIQELIEPMVTGSPYPIKALVNYGMNLFHSIPNVERTRQAIRNLDFYLAIDVLPMDHVMWADVVLPEATYLERYDDLLAQAHKTPYIALREPAIQPLHDSKPGWWIARELGTRLGLGAFFPWADIEEYLDHRLHTVGSSLQGIREAGGVLIQKGQPYIEDLEAVKKPPFPTPSGKILLYNEKLKAAGHDPVPRYVPVPEPPEGMFRLTYGRAPMHTFGKTQNNGLLSKVMAENELWLNSGAAQKLGLKNGQYVEMTNQDGAVSEPIRLKVTERIRPDLVFMVHGFGHQAPGLHRANGQGASDASMQTRYALDPISGGGRAARQLRLGPPRRSQPGPPDPLEKGGPGMTRFVMAIDLDRCLGCDACVVACMTENQVPIDAGARLRMREVVMGTFPKLTGEFRPEACFHCDDPPCVAACPTGATFQTLEGVVLTNDDRCAGCKACMTACPYGMRYLHPEGYVDKCTYCYHRLKQGRQPACVETCPTGARIFGDLDDPNGPVRQAIASARSVDRVEAVGGATPSLIYLNSRVLGSRRAAGKEHV